MPVNAPNVPLAQAGVDAKLFRLAWLLNAATASFTETKVLLQQLPGVRSDLEYLLSEADLPPDRAAFLRSELARFQRECDALRKSLEEAGRLTHAE